MKNLLPKLTIVSKLRPYAFDFDGVIAQYDGFKGADQFGLPNEKVVAAMRQLKQAGHTIIVHSTRSEGALREYCASNDIPVDYYNQNPEREGANPGKPIAYAYIDDRAICYRGQSTHELVNEILQFQAHWETPTFFKTYAVPVSIKGIVFENDRVWLRKNERDEWELPGGKLDEGEQPDETVVREIKEELGLAVHVITLVQTHLYSIKKSIDESKGVLVVSYLCSIVDKVGNFEEEGEAGPAEFALFTVDETAGLNMPEFYKKAITEANLLRGR